MSRVLPWCAWLFLLTLVAVARAGEPIRVYSNDFDRAPGEEWSNRETARTPVGGRPFLLSLIHI